MEPTLIESSQMRELHVSPVSKPIGRCIYCGNPGSDDNPLGREHAVPYALNGPWILLAASCEGCADITSRLERSVTREFFGSIRAVLAMNSYRKKKKRNTTLPLLLGDGPERRETRVPLAEYPAYLPAPVFPPPGVVAGVPPGPTTGVRIAVRHVAGPTIPELVQRLGTSVYAKATLYPDAFLRTLAKIGFCAAVRVVGWDAVRNSPLRPVILGEDPYVSHWVGGWTGDPQCAAEGLHRIVVRSTGTAVHVFVRLFGQYGAPEYHVVVGDADPEYIAADAWPWK